MKNNITFREPSLTELFKLASLCKKGVEEDYHFYDPHIKRIIINRHSFFNLLKARVNSERFLYAAFENNIAVALIIGNRQTDGVGAITWLYVHPNFRNKRIAKRLLKETESYFITKGCHKLSVSTEIAQHFYQKIGYSAEGVFKQHSWGKDFYFFGKHLKDRIFLVNKTLNDYTL